MRLLLLAGLLLAADRVGAFPSSKGLRAAAARRTRALGLRLSKAQACAGGLVAASLMLCSPATLAIARADAAPLTLVAPRQQQHQQAGAALPTGIPASWDLYGRMQRVENTMFTKNDAKEMRAEMKADAKEMRDEMKADAKEMWDETRSLFAATIFFFLLLRAQDNARWDKQRAEKNVRWDKQRAEDNASWATQRAEGNTKWATQRTEDIARMTEKSDLSRAVAVLALIVAVATPLVPQLLAHAATT